MLQEILVGEYLFIFSILSKESGGNFFDSVTKWGGLFGENFHLK